MFVAFAAFPYGQSDGCEHVFELRREGGQSAERSDLSKGVSLDRQPRPDDASSRVRGGVVGMLDSASRFRGGDNMRASIPRAVMASSPETPSTAEERFRLLVDGVIDYAIYM